MKVTSIYMLNGEELPIPAPFGGFRFETIADFKALVKRFYNKETGFPGLFFTTKDPETNIVFSGHEYEHPEGKGFSIYHNGDDKPHDWFNLRQEDESWFDLFMDAEVLDARIRAFTKLVNACGGVTIELTNN